MLCSQDFAAEWIRSLCKSYFNWSLLDFATFCCKLLCCGFASSSDSDSYTIFFFGLVFALDLDRLTYTISSSSDDDSVSYAAAKRGQHCC